MIPLFKQYAQELNELSVPYSFDLDIIEEGMTIELITGEEFLVNSIKSSENGFVLEYVNLDGIIVEINSNEVVVNKVDRKLFWYDAIKAIIAMDIIKMGGSFSGGGVIVAGQIYNRWRNSISKKLQGIRQHSNYNYIKSQSDKISSILNSDDTLISIFNELVKYPYIDAKFISSFIGKNAKKKIDYNRKIRRELIEQIGTRIITRLTEEDLKFIKEINEITKQK